MFPFKDDNPHTSFPIVTIILIAVNAAVFLFELSLGGKESALFMASFGMVPQFVSHVSEVAKELPLHPYYTFFTSMFLHGGWMHLIGNMLYLWIFGDNIEHAMGKVKYLSFYILMGIVAGLTHFAFNVHSQVPTVGASGAIAGVLGAYINLFPHARVHTLLIYGFFTRVVLLPSIFVLGFWFVLQLLEAGMTPKGLGGVAYGAHIGGFVAGYLLVRFFCKPTYRYFKRRL